ncbi:MAG: ABC transporter permease [Lachnospiraceae bacterium]|nr:ABC transporter permease [Lachnospiraceae bacterium]
MDKKLKKNAARFLLIYIIIVIGFYFIGDQEIRTKKFYLDILPPEGTVNEVCQDRTLEQTFLSETDIIEKFTFHVATFGRTNRGLIYVSLIDNHNHEMLAQLVINAELLQDNSFYEWNLDKSVKEALGKSYSLVVTSECPEGEAPTFYCSNQSAPNAILNIDGNVSSQTLCFSYEGRSITGFGENYWLIAGSGGVALAIYFVYANWRMEKGKHTFIGMIWGIWNRYKFLIQQLVSRDFKTKYKRSVLGYLWSFLNPLLTMTVQYIVFSTIFRSDIKNFPVYLLSGIILFNFFSDAVGQGLSAIVNNTALITKVYVPKYIYPVTKVVSCSINLMISIIPLLLVALLTGAPITKALLLLPFGIICLVVFCIGLSLVLCSAMVFFRDTQYLWGIVSLAWMYATPLFYPEHIIPAQFKLIQKLNPMYYIIKFVRTLMIEGVSPDISLYVYCIIFSMGMLAIGAAVFKKTQDRFVLYI